MNAKMWMKYPLTRVVLRGGATRFGILPTNHFSLGTTKATESYDLGVCETEFLRGCEHAMTVFLADFMRQDTQAIARYTTPNLSMLMSDQSHGNAPYVHDIAHDGVEVNVIGAGVVHGFVQRPEYPLGFLRARDFMDGAYGPEKFLLHPTEKRVAIISFTATETYRIWERNDDQSSEPLYDETGPVQHVFQLEHDMLGNVGDSATNADESWVISGINGYE
jgi:hypothetical protein